MNPQTLITDYCNWLEYEFDHNSTLDESICITGPYLDRTNTFMSVYIYDNDNDYTITDGGEILSDLENNDINIHSQKNMELIVDRLRNYGILIDKTGAIYKSFDKNNDAVSLRKDMNVSIQMLFQGMIVISNLNYCTDET